jgi:transcriptional regulator with XRE-family HTH domain
VAGLRREEVATLAGISVDYYVRLEQGRETRPSTQVLDALSGVLRLDDGAREHLHQIAGAATPPRRAADVEEVDPELLRLMRMWPDTPAIVLGRAYDVLAGNDLAYSLFEGFEHGPNLLLKLFADPAATAFYADWEPVARYTVAGFRLMHGRYPDDLRIAEVVAELTARSTEFVEMWQRHEARGDRMEAKTFVHPAVGELTLRINAFDVRSAPGQELVVYHAEPGSPSAAALERLRSLTATVRDGGRDGQAAHRPTS